MTTTPEVALLVAVIAVIGVVITAYVSYRNSETRGDIDKRLVELKAHYDAQNSTALVEAQSKQSQRLQALEHSHKTALAQYESQHSDRLQEIQHLRNVELKELEARLQAQLSAERMRELLNEANWKRVHDQIRSLKAVGFDMVGSFKELALHGHEVVDEKVVPEVAAALRLHTEFKGLLREVRGGIRDDDYRHLSDLHKYLVEVFLDLARTQAERVSRVERMSAHHKRISTEEHYIEVMANHFLKPTIGPMLPFPSQRGG